MATSTFGSICFSKICLKDERHSSTSSLLIPQFLTLKLILLPRPVTAGLQFPLAFAGPVDWPRTTAQGCSLLFTYNAISRSALDIPHTRRDFVKFSHDRVGIELICKNLVDDLQKRITLLLPDSTGDSERIVIARVRWTTTSARNGRARNLALSIGGGGQKENRHKYLHSARIISLLLC